tara:strand:- start:561 stop:758 length:198 start_codon:yes stop_codon:yes gene_type:complete
MFKEYRNKRFRIQRTNNNNFNRMFVVKLGFVSIYDGLINILSLGYYSGYYSDEIIDEHIKSFYYK